MCITDGKQTWSKGALPKATHSALWLNCDLKYRSCRLGERAYALHAEGVRSNSQYLQLKGHQVAGEEKWSEIPRSCYSTHTVLRWLSYAQHSSSEELLPHPPIQRSCVCCRRFWGHILGGTVQVMHSASLRAYWVHCYPTWKECAFLNHVPPKLHPSLSCNRPTAEE